MLFMSLLIYFILWFPYYKSLRGVFPLSVIWFSPIFLYAFSILLSLLILYEVHSFSPETKPFLKNLLRINGIRWIAFLSSVMALISLGVITVFKGINPDIFGLFLPIAAVSFLNTLGGRVSRAPEIFPRMLEEEVTPKVVKAPREPETPEIPEDILKEFKWKHKEQPYTLKLVIRHSVYEEFKSKERLLRHGEWAREYVAGGICGEIRDLSHRLLRIGKPYGTYEEVEFVLSFVQQIITYEKEKDEYPKYPVETLADEAGDCEDFSIFGAAILKVIGYDVSLLSLPGHAALGVAGASGIPGEFVEHDSKKYYYCEMTAEGWKIGEIPDKYKDVKIGVHPIPGIIIDMDLPKGQMEAETAETLAL